MKLAALGDSAMRSALHAVSEKPAAFVRRGLPYKQIRIDVSYGVSTLSKAVRNTES
jgi:hypothetical protein